MAKLITTYKKILIDIQISIFVIIPFFTISQPVNDNICNAISLTVNSNDCTLGTNVSATTVSSDKIGTCWYGGTKSHTVWYYFVAPTSGNVMITTDHSGGTLTNSQIGVYSSSDNTCTGTLTEVGCDENGGSECANCAAAAVTGLTPGSIYFVEIDGYSTNTGTFCIDVHDGGDILTNDSCINAMNVWVGSSCNLSYQCTFTSYPNSTNTIATGEAWETAPACWTQGTALNTAWYKFTAVNTTTNIQIEAVTGGTDPHVAIYSGTCGSLTLVACQENKGGGGAAGKGVNLNFLTNVGQTYYIQYDNDVALGCNRMCVNSTSGSTTPVNNICASAQSLTLNSPLSGNNWLATADGSFSCGTTENDVWYYYTPSTNGTYYFTFIGQTNCYALNNSGSTHTSFYQASLQMTLYNTGTCTPTSANEFDCVSSENTNDIDLSAYLLAGNTYLLNIDGLGGTSCQFSIEVSDYSILPVSLISFDGYNEGGINVLKWVTASETNNALYTIERSENAVNFNVIGTIRGAGNSNTYVSYIFNDEKPLTGINYYRLKQTDFDGSYRYISSIIAIENLNNDNHKPNMNIIPNPNDGVNIMVEISGFNNEEVFISVQDILGMEIFFISHIIDKDKKNIIPVNIDKKLNTGIYVVSITDKFNTVNKKMIIK